MGRECQMSSTRERAGHFNGDRPIDRAGRHRRRADGSDPARGVTHEAQADAIRQVRWSINGPRGRSSRLTPSALCRSVAGAKPRRPSALGHPVLARPGHGGGAASHRGDPRGRSRWPRPRLDGQPPARPACLDHHPVPTCRARALQGAFTESSAVHHPDRRPRHEVPPSHGARRRRSHSLASAGVIGWLISGVEI